MAKKEHISESYLVSVCSKLVDWGIRYLTLYRLFFRSDKNFLPKIELLNVLLSAFSFCLLFTFHLVPEWLAICFSLLMVQRVVEFIIVYTQNFIFKKGPIYLEKYDEIHRGEWFIFMFAISIFQVILSYSYIYRFLSIYYPESFNIHLEPIDCLYFTVGTFTTLGLGDIVPTMDTSKLLVFSQGILTFFLIIVVFNGLSYLHFLGKQKK